MRSAAWLGLVTVLGACAPSDGLPPVRESASEPGPVEPPQGQVGEPPETGGPDAASAAPPDAALQPAAPKLDIEVATFNVQASDASARAIAEQLASTRPAALWGLSEVSASWGPELEEAFERGADRDYGHVLGTDGGSTLRLLAAFDRARFTLVEWEELDTTARGRSPLVLELEDNERAERLLFMVNHLQRANAQVRHAQARALHAWALSQTLPVIAVGDYNFDWALANGDADHDRGYDILTADAVFEWVRPEALFPTQCSGYRSVLDFIFVAQGARAWARQAEVLDTARPCVDDAQRSDHRPVWARLTP